MRGMNLRRCIIVGFGLFSAASIGFLLECAPSEDTSVSIVTQCDANALNAADPAEATVKVYLQTATDALNTANDLVTKFQTVCNAINTDLGDPQGGDVHAACNNIAARIAKAATIPPVAPGTVLPPVWVAIAYDALSCAPDTAAEAACLNSCSGGASCDPVGACAAGALTGSCGGNCTGSCKSTGSAVACQGGCFGKCDFPSVDGGAAPGLPACGVVAGVGVQGECVGTCKAPTWLGRCSTGCAGGFLGQCLGTCTGSCDTAPYPLVDAGDPDAGDGGLLPGAGNCTGVCSGSCTGQASGSCGKPCQGQFAGGGCGATAGLCIGTCNGNGVPCTTTCEGTCAQKATQCSGSCDTCSVSLTDAGCAGAIACGKPNPICAGTCTVRGAIAAQCGSSPVSINLAGDYKLYDALSNHMADFSALARQANVINSNLAGVLQQSSAAFHAIGVVSDNARLCATSASPTYDTIRQQISTAVSASLVLSGTKF